MAAEDIDTLRSLLDELSAKGYESILSRVHPDFRMETLPELATEPQVYEGPDGMRRWWESFYDVMDEIQLRAIEYRDAGPGLVAVEMELAARGQASGIEAVQQTFALVALEDGQLIRFDFFHSLDAAVAAAG